MASTLALGQAQYDLLEIEPSSEGAPEGSGVLETSGEGVVRLFADESGEVSNINVGITFQPQNGSQHIDALNVYGDARNLNVRDSVANTPGGTQSIDEVILENDANINFIGNVDDSEVALNGGNDRVNVSRDFVDGQVTATWGNDTVRVGGIATESEFFLGQGDDMLILGRGASGVDVALGEGNDTAMILGKYEEGELEGYFTELGIDNSTGMNNLLDMGKGDDKALLLDGVQGSVEVQLGEGEDTVIFGRGSQSKGFKLGTGTGEDSVVLGQVTEQTHIDLGHDSAGDTVVLGFGSLLANSSISSANGRDSLSLAGDLEGVEMEFSGSGDAFVEASGNVLMGDHRSFDTSVWDLGAGNDTLSINGDLSMISSTGKAYFNLGSGSDSISLGGSASGFGQIEFDLGDDDHVDVVHINDPRAVQHVSFSNFGHDDILYIGDDMYGYNYDDIFVDRYLEYDEFIWVGNAIYSQEQSDGTYLKADDGGLFTNWDSVPMADSSPRADIDDFYYPPADDNR